MFKNFLRITFRNISRNKVFTFLNITGLATGLAASLLIMLWIQDEFSFENFNANAENIYRVEEDQFYSGQRYHVTVTPHPSGPEWMQKIPEIKDQTRINRLPRVLFRYDEKLFFESSVISADSGLFTVFSFPLLSGDKTTMLREPNSIVLSEKLAIKYFGETDPVGKVLTLENQYQFTVTGVMKNLPRNSMFTFEAIVPYSFLRKIGALSDNWGNNSILTFVLLEKGADIRSVNKKLTDVVLEHNPETTTKFVLFPLNDIHLYSQFGFTETKGPVIAIVIFTLIAVFVLLIACINFINLSTAKATTRTREIVIKKVSGADQKLLALQFMFESVVMVTMALVLALLLVALFLDTFNGISGKKFILSDLLNAKFIISFIAVGLVSGFISGIYPALYLSSIKPVAVLKGETLSGKGNGRLRQILVVVQFSLSILIAVCAIFMYLQLKFLREKELGFNKENLICIPMPQGMKPKYYTLKKDLENESLIQGVTASNWNPVMIGSNSGGASWDGKDPEKHVLIGTNTVDYDYLKTMGMKLKSGRDFSRDFPSDLAADTTGNFLINEEVVKLMDIGDPVGKNFSFMGIRGTIVGVLENFHFKGADQSIEPIAFALTGPSNLNVILIRLTQGKVSESLKSVEKVWKQVVPEYPLDYSFISQDYDNLFRSVTRVTNLLKYFTVLAILIACLGLYGLASYTAERRTNEVGIRKVMGASSLSVIYTLSKEFMILVLISILIAVPAGWIIAGKLLGQFAYHIGLNPLIFLLIATVAIFIALLTVSFQAYRASTTNPADAIKVE